MSKPKATSRRVTCVKFSPKRERITHLGGEGWGPLEVKAVIEEITLLGVTYVVELNDEKKTRTTIVAIPKDKPTELRTKEDKSLLDNLRHLPECE